MPENEPSIKSGNEIFSIYNAKDKKVDSQLSFLHGDMTNSWNAQRNLMKALNHLALLQRKETIAEMLALHNTRTPSIIFKKNYQLLEDHKRGKISTENLISQLKERTSLSNDEIIALLEEYVPLGHLEFHPSDICNLRCQGCTYGHDERDLKPQPQCFPFPELNRLALFSPKSILISGGGEPTLYSNSYSGRKYTFNDLILRIKEILPAVRLALVTNGTFRPEGEWPNYLDWIRVSVDAATEKTFGKFRGKTSLFEKVVNNLIDYLKTPVKYVGASFLYSQININEYVDFAKFMYDLIREQAPQYLHKFNLQYRPLRKDPKDEGRDFPAAITNAQIKEVINKILQFSRSSPDIKNFLREQTNIEAVLGGNNHPPHEFSRCYYSQVFHIIRANGEIRPCFIRVVEPDFVLGNLLDFKMAAVSLNCFYIASCKKKHCDPYGCRQCHVNYLFEAGLNGNIPPLKNTTIINDPFF